MATSANVLAELSRLGIDCEYLPVNSKGEIWVRTLCPFHVDSHPSCDINTETKKFHCKACNTSGDFSSYLARKLNTERHVIIADLKKRYGSAEDKIVEVEVVEREHQDIWKATPLLKELSNRAVGEDLIRQFRLGEYRGTISIPIKNSSGEYVDILRYQPGAPSRKFTHLSGRGSVARLYPIEQLAYSKLMLCGGPIKAIAALAELNTHGIGCITSTNGETNWDNALNILFKDKECVYVGLDIDKPGRKAADLRCAQLSVFAKKIYNLVWPLDIADFPKGDSNDYQAKGGKIIDVINKTEQWEPKVKPPPTPEAPIDMELVSAFSAENSRKRVKVKVMVSALDQSPYHLPQAVAVKCDRQQDQCGICPILPLVNNPIVTLPPESDAILGMLGEPTFKQADYLKEALHIPVCPVVTFETTSSYHVEDIKICPELSLNSNNDSILASTVCVHPTKNVVDLNETYYMTGQFIPHPNTQAATFIVSETEPAVDALSSFELTAPEELEIFQPSAWTLKGITNKIDDIVNDLEVNVTRIYGRPELHIAIGLTYHSCMLIPHGTNKIKGWAETLIVSDSSQGKSTAVEELIKHYGLGEKVECKSATVAGLVGGLQQFNSKGKWYAKWGVIPTHDRRLVVLEELKGLSREVFSKLTEMRSSGIADIPKIERRKAHARTRLIALSNSRSGQAMSSYNYGVDVVKELIPNLEDIRRFDLTILLNVEDLDSQILNAKALPNLVQPRYLSEQSRQLVLWAWTRKFNQVYITPEAEELLSTEAQKLCEKFVDTVPILDRGSTRHKLARLAVSCACWTFSCDDTYEYVKVRPCHVEYVSEFINQHYSSKAHGYADFSKYTKTRGQMQNSDEIINKIVAAPKCRELVEHILHASEIELVDFCDWTGCDRNEISPLVSCLVQNRAITRDGKVYRKSAGFVTLLQKALNNGVLHVPEHIRDEEEF